MSEPRGDDPIVAPPVDVGLPGSAAGGDAATAGRREASTDGDVSLLALVDRLTILLERSDLTELEVEAGGTALVLRKASAMTAHTAGSPAGAPSHGADVPAPGDGGAAPSGSERAAGSPAPGPSQVVVAPLTGIYYAAPTPDSPPFVASGREVAVGQVIGLIEAMKLFNEIKSDKAGRVVRVVAENGALVKAKQPLIEVEPL